MIGFENIQQIKLYCNTWNKDAHALFDYESESIEENIFQLGKGGKLIRDEEKNNTKYEPDTNTGGFFLTGGNSSSSEGCLANFYNEYGTNIRLSKKIQDEYIFNKDNITQVQSMLYYVVSQKEFKGIKREYKSEYECKPKINDIIRFGRVQFIVRELKDKSSSNKNNDSLNNDNDINKSVFLPNENVQNEKKEKCYYCEKYESDSIKDPLIKICPCKDSPKFHLYCFWKYLKTERIFKYKKDEYKSGSLIIINFINFLCPICNEPFNPVVSKNGKFFNLIPYDFDKKIYHIVLESINFVKDGVYCVMVIICLFNNKKDEFFLGRGHEASFKISDISISRVHAKISLKHDEIVLDDLGSKFGTLLLIRKNIELSEMLEKKMRIQIGRSVFWIEEDKNKSDNK